MTDRWRAARALLDQASAMGLQLADLVAVAEAPAAPTVAVYVDAVVTTFTPGTARTYLPYLRLAAELYGGRRLDDLTVTDLQRVVDEAATRARRRRPGSTGRSSRETTVAALRALFARAVADGHVTTNPALGLTKSRSTRSRRRALTDDELTELIDAIRTTSRDPDLDLLLVRFHLESGARRQGTLNLHLGDLDPARATAWLREKNDTEREQPISPALCQLLHDHAISRGATRAHDAVFRTRTLTAMSERRYSTIVDRARPCLAWGLANAGLRARPAPHRHYRRRPPRRLPRCPAFAGHAQPSVTGTYLHATIEDIATAVATLTGLPHPLAHWAHGRGALCGRRRARRADDS
jgi:site-specific recombinase XerD